jgi:hypothetical protein
LGIGSAGATVVSHTFTAISGNIDSNISFTTEKNDSQSAPAFNSNLRLYYGSGNGCSITLHTTNGVVITNVSITAVSNYTPTVNYNVDGGADVNASLSGTTYTISNIFAASTLKIRNANTTNTQLRIASIEVTYSSACTSANLAFSGISDGKKFVKSDVTSFTQAASSDSPATITYESSNEAVATVDATGQVTIAGTGTTTISAEQQADDIYCPATAEYTLIVGEEFQLVTQDRHLIADGEYIIVSESGNGHVALGYQKTSNRGVVAVDITAIIPVALVGSDEQSAYKFKLGGSVGAWTITDVANNYKIGPATGTGSDNHLKRNDNAIWTISIAPGTSVATIVCTGGGHSTRNILRYNSSSTLFACYDINNDQKDVYLYATSETLSSATAIGSTIVDDAVVATKYYNLQGQEIVTPQSGNIYVAKKIHASGKVSATKELKK